MNPDELSEGEKLARFHAAIAKEEECVAIEDAQHRQRERTRKLIWVAAVCLVIVLWGFLLAALASKYGEFFTKTPAPSPPSQIQF